MFVIRVDRSTTDCTRPWKIVRYRKQCMKGGADWWLGAVGEGEEKALKKRAARKRGETDRRHRSDIYQ